MQSIALHWLAALPVFMVFNRIRGGGMSSLTDRLPGRALYYVSAVLGALTAAILDPLLGVVVALGFLIWGAPGWGLWFDLHRDDDAQRYDPRRDDLFVQLFELAAFGSDYLALFFRLAFLAFPAVTAWVVLEDTSPLLALAPLVFGLLGVGAYELRWRTPWGNTLSELLIGALWWALVLSMALAVPG